MKRTRSVAALLAAVCTAGLGATGAFAQGTCATAVELTVGAAPIQGTLVGVTAQAAPTFTSGCSASVSNTVRGAFYRFTTGAAGVYEISGCALPTTTANAFDSVVLVWANTGTPCAAGQTVVACNDDSCGTRSSVAASLLGATEYYVRYAEFSSATTAKDFTIAVYGPSATPANNTCATATAQTITSPITTITGTTGGSDSSTTLATCGTGGTSSPVVPTGASAWYAITVPGLPSGITSYTYTASLCGNFDTILTTHTSCAATTSSVCNDDTAPSAFAGCGFGSGSQLTFTQASTSPTTVFLRVAGTRSSVTTGSGVPQFGDFTLTIAGPEANDTCAGAVALALSTPASGNSAGNSSTNDGAASTCSTSTSGGAWYSFTPGTDGQYLISTCDSPAARDTILTVFSAGTTCGTGTTGTVIGNSAQILACNNDAGFACTGTRASLQTSLVAGQTYLVRVSFTSTTLGAYTVRVDPGLTSGACCTTAGVCSLVSSAANCASPSTYQGDNTVCSPNPCPQPVACCNNFNASCVLTLPALCTGPNTAGAPGSVCSSCTVPAPSNGTCATAQALTLGTAATGSNFGKPTGTTQGAFGSCPDNAGNKDVWFSFTAPAAGLFRFSTCGSTLTSVVGTTQHDTQLIAYNTTDCAAGLTTANILACSEDFSGCGTGLGFNSQFDVSLNAGQQIRVRLTTYSTTGAGGYYSLLATQLVSGACCSSTSNACTITTSTNCASPSTYQGDNTVCSPNPCPVPPGACCTSTGCTIVADAAACSGIFSGAGTVCNASACTGACCTNPGASPTCTVIGSAACTGTFKGVGSTCTNTPCPNTSSPENDECAAAAEIPPAGGTIAGNNASASTDPMPNLAGCTGGGQATFVSTRDLWYSITPTTTAQYSITLCNTTTGTRDTAVSVHSACPTPQSNFLISCNDDGCSGTAGPSAIASITLNGGTTYYIRVSMWSTTAGGAFSLVVGPIVGTCCNNSTGACTVTTQADCAAGPSALWTAGQTCGTGACAAVQGTCCNPNTGGCTITFQSACASGSTFVQSGTASVCNTTVCPVPTGACCTNGACAVVSAASCTSPSTFLGANTTCTPNNCPQPPANDLCANASVASVGANTGTAALATNDGSSSCQLGAGVDVWWSFLAPFSGNYGLSTCAGTTDWDTVLSLHTGCPGTTANEIVGGCADQGCASGNLSSITAISLSAGTTYTIRIAGWSSTTLGNAYVLTITQPATGACCAANGVCIVNSEAGCSGTYQGDGTVCDPNPCPQPQGACCASDGSCTVSSSNDCAGSFQGAGTVCSPNPCPQPALQLCCRGATCAYIPIAQCVVVGAGSGTQAVSKPGFTGCSAPGASNTLAGCCYADYDKNSVRTIDDIFIYLNAWFANSNYTKVGGDGTQPRTIDDIFLFLNAWFAGCN